MQYDIMDTSHNQYVKGNNPNAKEYTHHNIKYKL